MCVNYLPATRRQLREHFAVTPPETEWPDECWQDYAAPILLPGSNGQLQAYAANYGFVPRRHQREGIRLATLNARDDSVALRPTWRDAWQRSQLCLVPMLAFFEPCYETGRAVRHRIALADGQPFAVAGLWRRWQEADGSSSLAFAQLTINADEHPLLRRMHLPGDEKRSLVLVPRSQYGRWLGCRQPATATRLLLPYPAGLMASCPAPLRPDAVTQPFTPDLFSRPPDEV
ncbi:SOS response-associated peptidase family protein [Vogesella sp. DC21W]|uniref:Abasic site processing protein n=1 Tax=Vogesella aquatica TaxID=2984206 RepID=A0ABT5IZS0_9NEIS|nr:SOS response-associated peptidase family protein [Vogesella aquatica]MDC7717770.1 SOS response-associated peptidase family protein [Vogesella aquatica]